MIKKGFMNTKIAFRAKAALAILLTVVSVAILIFAAVRIGNSTSQPATFVRTATFVREAEEEEPDSDLKRYPVTYTCNVGETIYSLERTFTPEEYEELPEDDTVMGYIYEDGRSSFVFDHEPEAKELKKAQRSYYAVESEGVFGVAMACLLTAVGLAVMVFFGKFFTNYEQLWFLSILVLAAVFSLLFPEEEANGVNGLIIMALYLADTFLNILCELLISKQSKWNFIVSVFVEITEIVICLVLMYRFATLASTLFFWLPCDIISFINWHKHPDRVEEELTQVRTLKGWQEALIITGIVVWTVGIGYFLTTLDLGSDFFKNRTVEVIVCYMDACATAVGIANGLFILFCFREQWIAWYIEALLEAVMNILAGQFVLLVLKVGYLTNTTYGYIKWTKYIKAHEEAAEPQKIGNRQ